jgi:hypothetical protein
MIFQTQSRESKTKKTEAFDSKSRDITEEWKSKINLEGDVTNGNALKAHVFLQILVTFDIAS